MRDVGRRGRRRRWGRQGGRRASAPVQQRMLGELRRLEVVLEQRLRKVAVHLVRLVFTFRVAGQPVQIWTGIIIFLLFVC